ncbi:helix-turn-helix transcriptional regulator [Acinetobacter sp. SM34]|uniref:winged helix-turn-helix transcriptional regulator n=1 Tax=Acinetobacter sp. SM34 TaxID=1301620 RepID=UPI001EDB85E3|nr:helix-turn-helix domain-containing protein [Acinetobacter sp. SM34]MCG2608404.1 helix-turn-helix transcriptional regulator [Acinetobacter sp. SM34]
MKWDEIGEQPCSIARTLSVIGDRWTVLILRNAFLGMRRFESFQQNLGITRHVLSDRLKHLVEHGILVKKPYVQRQERYEYCLTEKGLALYPILMSMAHWADQWMNKDLGQPMQYIHQSCGHSMTPRLVCSECNETIHAKHIKAELTPDYFNYLQQHKIQS